MAKVRRLEYVQGTSAKFWEIALQGSSFTVQFGRIGTDGRAKKKTFAPTAMAKKEHDKLVAEKCAKGYTEVRSGKTGAKAPARRTETAAKTPKCVATLRKLVDAAANPGEPMTRVHLLVPEKGPWVSGSVNRAGGPPIGVDEKTRPRWEQDFMQHLLTLDLPTMPELRALPKLKRARALALFISSADNNCAFEPTTRETAVVLLSDAEVRRGDWSGPKVDDPRPRAFSVWPVDVPTRVFPDDGMTCDDDLDELFGELVSIARAGGNVAHHNDDVGSLTDFVCQFRDDLVEVNLGDGGTMFVSAGRAFWHGG